MTDFVDSATVSAKVDDQASQSLERVANAADKAALAVDRVEQAAVRAGAQLTASRDSVDRMWASLDRNVAALQRYEQQQTRVENFERQGLLLGGEKQAMLDALARRYEVTAESTGLSEGAIRKWEIAALRATQVAGAAGVPVGAFNSALSALGASAGGPVAVGVAALTGAMVTLADKMREVPQYTDEARRSLEAWGKEFEKSPIAAYLGISPAEAAVPFTVGGRASFPGAIAPTDATRFGRGMRAGAASPGSEEAAAIAMRDEIALKIAESTQRSMDASAEAAQKHKEEIASALKELDDTDAHFHNEKMKRLHEEVEEAKRAIDEESRAREQAMRALDDTDKFLAAERMRRFHDEVSEQKSAAADIARRDSANVRQLGNDIVRLVGALGVGSGSGGNAALGQGLALLFSSLDGTSSLGRNFAGLFGARTPANDGIPDIEMTPQVFGSNPGGFMSGGGFAKAAPYLSAGIQGFQLGSVFGSIGGGNSTNAGIGGGIGGIAGSFLPIPGGKFIGSAIGSVIGSLFGPTHPSNFTAVANFGGGLGVTGMGGDKPNSNTTGLAGNAAAQIEQAVAALQGYGATFGRGLDFLAIGEQRNSYFRLAGDTANRTIGSTGDPNDLALQALRALLPSLSGGSANLGTALGRAGSAAEFQSISNFVVNVYDVLTRGAPAATQMETAMKDLVKSFRDSSNEARRLGLDVGALTSGFAKSFNEDVRLSLMGIQEPLKASLELWRRDAQARLNTAASIGGDIGQVNQLNAALFRQMREPQIAALTGLQNQIGFGAFSAAAPGDQYFTALSAFNTAKASALGGGDSAAFVTAAQNLLPVARNFLGTSEAYGSLSRDISATANILKEDLGRMPELTPLIEATVQTGAATVGAIADLKTEVKNLADEQKRVNGILMSLAFRAA